MKHIDSKSFLYNLFRKYVCFTLTKCFYRKVTVIYDEQIPENEPVVFAANHQNAMMDALLIACISKNRQPVFFSRADDFKNRLLSIILRWIKVAPLYRIVDGIDKLQGNSKSFDLSTAVLSRKNSIAIFPEGTHNDKEQILPLKKGMARMVLQSELKYDFNLNVNVIPISISFSDYFKPRAEVRIQLGKPIKFTHLKYLYIKNPAKALLEFNEEFDFELKKIATHVEDINTYPLIQRLLNTLQLEEFGENVSFAEKYNFRKNFIDRINKLQMSNSNNLDFLFNLASGFYSDLQKKGISEQVFIKKNLTFKAKFLNIFLLFVLSPFAILGFVLNYFPFVFLYFFVKRNIKDTQFRSTIYFVLTLLIFAPIFYLIQFLIFVYLSNSLLLGLLSIPLMLVLGLIAKEYFILFKKFRNRLNENRFSINHIQKLECLNERRKKIIEKLKTVIG